MINFDHKEYYKKLYDEVINSLKKVNNYSFCKYTKKFYDTWLCDYLIYIQSYISIKGEIYMYYEFEYNLLFKCEQHQNLDDAYLIHSYNYDNKYNNILTKNEYNNLMYNMTELRKKYLIIYDKPKTKSFIRRYVCFASGLKKRLRGKVNNRRSDLNYIPTGKELERYNRNEVTQYSV